MIVVVSPNQNHPIPDLEREAHAFESCGTPCKGWPRLNGHAIRGA
jgi:hypothetical protein